MHLSNKCREYGSELIEVTEEYTSKTCTNCGVQSENYNNRIKKCNCGYKINRDINGARNILIKNIKKVVISSFVLLVASEGTLKVSFISIKIYNNL